MKQSLSHRRLVVLILLVLFGFAVLIASVIPNVGGSVLRDNIQNSGHVVVFAIVAIVAFGFGRSWGLSYFNNYCQAALVGLICGVGIEAVQYPLAERDASLGDIGRDAIGVAAGLLVVAGLVSFRQATRRSWLWRVPALLVAIGLISFGVFPVFDCLSAQRMRDVTAPVLMGTETLWWERYLSSNAADWWLDDAPVDWPGNGDGKVCHVAFHPDDNYPGIHLRELWGNWSSADSFSFDIYSQMPETVELEVRINDQQHDQAGDDYYDRFNSVQRIRPGFQSISIPISEIRAAPKTRNMDMANIRGLFFFLPHPKFETHLQFDNIRLDVP